MAEPRFSMKKIWIDSNDDFYEVSLFLRGDFNTVYMDIYLDDDFVEELHNGLVDFTNNLGKKEYTWVLGHETEDSTHFLSMRFFLQEKRGIVGIEVNIDNKSEDPYRMCANFFILAEFGQLDDLARKLKKFLRNEINEVESLY